MKTNFTRCSCVRKCDGCGSTIELEQPMGMIRFEGINQNIFLCEDCTNDLQNDLSDDYQKFVGMKM